MARVSGTGPQSTLAIADCHYSAVMAARRRNMTSVDVYPGDSLKARLFAERCSAVFELYSLHLKAIEPIKATASWTRIFMADDGPAGYRDIAPEPPDNYGFGESLVCGVNREILDSPRSEWPQRYLDWLHVQLTALAQERGWDCRPLAAARQGCIDDGLRLVVNGKPKSSPDRRHKAFLRMRIDLDGKRLIRLTVKDRGDVEVAAAEQVHDPFHWNVADFKRESRELRWTSATKVELGESDLSVTVPVV